ncbi:MAG: peptide-methionine (S)-S-oxide reductase MsrA [Gammaproteobacteria bacterium]|nr:peptide-methionine (S)-S-oxide reductase MsrA [Gammaproteobacteria bacterium]
MHALARFASALFGLWLGTVSMAMAAEPAAQGNAPATAVFAGGCFWCMEPPFDALAGVTATTSGFTGGHQANPSYKDVSSGGTGHVEAVQISYDPAQLSYQELLDVYWRNIDPVDDGGQFCDRGQEYLSVIFYQNEEQKKLAEQSKATVEDRLGRPVATALRPAAPFYAAEDYHQDYYRKNPVRYKYYRYSCGRDQRLEELWGTQEK